MIDISRAMPGWTVEELIGKGSYGTVYRIKKEEMGYTYYSALKVIELPSDMKEVYNLQAMGMNEDSIKSYYEGTAKEIASEIRIMESLKSAGNVVHVEEHALIPKADGIGWTILIRMELLESIQKYQQKAGNPDYYETIKIGKDICSALQCCEEKGIIHRDIKPDNLFRNEFGMYKLGDFGIARQMQNTLAAYSQKGTIGFLAPEVYKGGYYDNTVDIYSLGVMLYVYMNRQRPPFVDLEITNLTAKTLDEAHWRRLSGELPPPPVDAPQQLADVILKACNPDPRRRYRTAAEFREALESCENGDIQPAKIFNIPSLFGKNRQRDIEAAEKQDYSPPEYPANYTNSQYVGEQGNVLAEESSGTANKGLMGVLIALIVVLFIAVSGGILYVNMPGLVQGITQVRITADKSYVFTASTSRLLFDGYQCVYNQEENEDKGEKLSVALSRESVLSLERFDPRQHFTQPAPHYTEASLVKALEEQGIGRPSTYAPTITTILARHYIVKEDKNLYMTELGEVVNSMMKRAFPSIVDPAFTAQLEGLLDGVAEGSVKWKTVIENFYPDLDEAVSQAEADLEKVKIADEETEEGCENCGRQSLIMKRSVWPVRNAGRTLLSERPRRAANITDAWEIPNAIL